MMKRMIYVEWGYEYDKAIQEAFTGRDVEICPFQLPVRAGAELYPDLEEKEKQDLQALVERLKPDAIFSVNFLGCISEFCMENAINYDAWVLVLPNMDLFTASVKNSCNRIGICDSYLTERLWKQKIDNIFFLPDAVAGCHRVKKETLRPCSFVGKVPYAYKDTPFGAHSRGLTENTMGYLAGMVHCQRVLYGATMLEDILIGTAAAELMEKYPLPEKVLPQFHKLYLAEGYLAPEVTRLEQIILLQNMASGVNIGVFSDGTFPDCEGQKFPYPETAEAREEVYATSIVNIVQADRSLHDAIPHQTLEIMASGNFVLTSYQKDYGYFFKQEEDIVCYGDRLQRAQLFNQYGMDPKERERITEAAYEKIRTGHTYAHRVDFMINNW